ncbi:MAG: T9SS type A sorting domain-containing protein [Candidatus Cloacimonetes bacterium]|nr:T9SS type A sorting domain-containing protein [Candidatus Cloacimonadota bacterium]
MKIFSLILVVLGSALNAVSIYDYFEKPTSQQIEQYYQNKALNPLRYTYNPLQIGNQWYYSGENEMQPILTFLGRSVTADSLIDGIMHYYVNGGFTMEHYYEYNQGDSVIAYNPNGFYPSENTHGIMWVFTPSTTYLPVWLYGMQTTTSAAFPVEIFGQTVMVIRIMFIGYNELYWAEMFGPIMHSFDFGHVGLVGCIIDGVNYGTIGNTDNVCTQFLKTELSCYPNPFQKNVTFDIKNINKTMNSISIFNLKGQLINGWQDVKSEQFIWNSKDKNGNIVTPGIYFIKISSGGSTIVKKIIKLSD